MMNHNLRPHTSYQSQPLLLLASLAAYRRSQHPLPMVDPMSSKPIHYAGFVHMVGKKKDVVREFGKVTDSTQKLRSALNMPPPTFEMLNELGMTVATKRYRFLAWRCASIDHRRLKYFTDKALKSPTAKVVPAPSWCLKWCEIQGVSKGPATVVSDPSAWEDLTEEMTRQFSPAYLMSESHSLSIAMKAILKDAVRGLLYFGLEQYPLVSRKEWDDNFPEVRMDGGSEIHGRCCTSTPDFALLLRTNLRSSSQLCMTPLWVIHYVIDHHLNSEGDPEHTYNEMVAVKKKEVEMYQAMERREQKKAAKREQAKELARLRREEER